MQKTVGKQPGLLPPATPGIRCRGPAGPLAVQLAGGRWKPSSGILKKSDDLYVFKFKLKNLRHGV